MFPPKLSVLLASLGYGRKAEARVGKAKEKTGGQIIATYILRNLPISTPNASIALVLPSHPLASMAELLWTLRSKEEKTGISVQLIS